MSKKQYKIIWGGRGFGDRLMCSFIVHILNDNGIQSVFESYGNNYMKTILDCKFKESGEKYIDIWLNLLGNYNKQSKDIVKFHLDLISDVILHDKEFVIERNYIPVKYEEHDINSVDVVLNTKTGKYTPYREWPYFNELKLLLRKNNISYLDIDENKIYGIELLNYIKKAKLYIGLETGASHYVSQFANNKSIILQSGYTTASFWASYYEYEFLQTFVSCSPCFKRENCNNKYKCMTRLDADFVFNKVIERM